MTNTTSRFDGAVHDELVWGNNSAVANEVQCEACGMVYQLNHTAQQ